MKKLLLSGAVSIVLGFALFALIVSAEECNCDGSMTSPKTIAKIVNILCRLSARVRTAENSLEQLEARVTRLEKPAAAPLRQRIESASR